ncbi:MAG TPA: transcription termination factor Rho [Microbacteriaceae bacterium]|nr:transcription termination factor Rho [Microbacteriaceae bacterium]
MTETPAQLATLKVAQLQEIAASLGIESGKLRKGELVDAIITARGGESALAAAPAETVEQSAPTEPEAETAPAGNSRSRRSRRASSTSASAHVNAEVGAGVELVPSDVETEAAEVSAAADGDETEPQREGRSRNRRNRNRNRDRERGESNGQGEDKAESTENQPEGEEPAERAEGEGSSRNRNRRERNRNRRTEDGEPELLEDDVLIPIAGILDVLDNYAFVRTSGYLPGPSDVYVSLGQVKKYNLRKGDAVAGSVKQPREGESNGRQKYNALVTVDTVNGQSVDEAGARAEFADFVPLYPSDALRLETERSVLATRFIDVVAPLGKGQRGVIVGAARTGKSTLIREVAHAVAQNSPDTHLMVVLVDERPEDATIAARTVRGEVIASTFDRTAEDHVTIAELAVERAKRLVELGHDVVVLIDSVSSLARAYRAHASGGRSFGGDPSSVFAIKKLFGAARKVENGGSLTIVGTVAEADRAGDNVLVDELRNAATSVVRLSSELATARVFPAIDVNDSATVRAKSFLSEGEVAVLERQRQRAGVLDVASAHASIAVGLRETASNVEYLAHVQRNG